MKTGAHGVTLVELMVALVVLAVLLALGTPALRDFVMDNRLATHANEMAAAFALARAEAVRRNTPISVVATGSDWARGARVGVDANADGTIDGEIVRDVPAAPDNVTVTPSPGFSVVTYRPTGQLHNVTGTLTLDLCDSRTGETGRRIEILSTGRAEVSDHAC